jgi:hypothetical protein
MSERINVGILGATGMVGQNYIRLLHNHPMFRVTHVAASPASAGKKYQDAVMGRWHMSEDIPDEIKDLVVADANDIYRAKAACSLVFSAVNLDKQQTARLESDYAAAGFAVVSNSGNKPGSPGHHSTAAEKSRLELRLYRGQVELQHSKLHDPDFRAREQWLPHTPNDRINLAGAFRRWI